LQKQSIVIWDKHVLVNTQCANRFTRIDICQPRCWRNAILGLGRCIIFLRTIILQSVEQKITIMDKLATSHNKKPIMWRNVYSNTT